MMLPGPGSRRPSGAGGPAAPGPGLDSDSGRHGHGGHGASHGDSDSHGNLLCHVRCHGDRDSTQVSSQAESRSPPGSPVTRDRHGPRWTIRVT